MNENAIPRIRSVAYWSRIVGWDAATSSSKPDLTYSTIAATARMTMLTSRIRIVAKYRLRSKNSLTTTRSEMMARAPCDVVRGRDERRDSEPWGRQCGHVTYRNESNGCFVKDGRPAVDELGRDHDQRDTEGDGDDAERDKGPGRRGARAPGLELSSILGRVLRGIVRRIRRCIMGGCIMG